MDNNHSNSNTTTRCSVIIIGAGISGISAAKVLAENGVDDVVILEAADRIGGRMRKEEFGGHNVELGAGWIAGVGGQQINPLLALAQQCGLRTCFSDYSNARYNIFDCNGKVFSMEVAAASYDNAVAAANEALQGGKNSGVRTPNGPLELAIDFILHDFEMAEAEPLPTFLEYGDKEHLVADERGYGHLVYEMADTFLYTSNGKILDSRLKLNQVVRELHHSANGVTVKTEDGSVYKANYVIVSVSIGVLQSQLISFSPPLPRWKQDAFSSIDICVYTKVFLKFPHRFWPCGEDKEFFIYADEKRGYYTFWQSMENAYPGSNILVVTLTNDESKRIEAQSDEETMREAMEVLRNMFGNEIPDAIDVLVPRWWNNRFQRGSYSIYPVHFDHQLIENVKAPVGRVYFAGEHTSTKYNGYAHGAYLSGIDTSKALLEEMRIEKGRELEKQRSLLKPLLALTLAQPDALFDISNQLFICSPKPVSRNSSFSLSESHYISA